MDQIDLFSPVAPKRSRRQRVRDINAKRLRWGAGRDATGSYEPAFKALIKHRPLVWATFHRIALEMLAGGVERISAKHVWERVRLEHRDVHLDNNLTALAARHLLKIDPRFHGVVEIRERRQS